METENRYREPVHVLRLPVARDYRHGATRSHFRDYYIDNSQVRYTRAGATFKMTSVKLCTIVYMIHMIVYICTKRSNHPWRRRLFLFIITYHSRAFRDPWPTTTGEPANATNTASQNNYHFRTLISWTQLVRDRGATGERPPSTNTEKNKW